MDTASYNVALPCSFFCWRFPWCDIITRYPIDSGRDHPGSEAALSVQPRESDGQGDSA